MEAHIGNKIRARLSQMPHLTVKAFAEKLGVHEQTVYDIYKRTDINTEMLRKISDALEVPMSYFFEQDDRKDHREIVDYQPSNQESTIFNGAYGTQKDPLPSGINHSLEEDSLRQRNPVSENGTTPFRTDATLRMALAWEKEKVAYLERIIRDKEYIIQLLETKLGERRF